MLIANAANINLQMARFVKSSLENFPRGSFNIPEVADLVSRPFRGAPKFIHFLMGGLLGTEVFNFLTQDSRKIISLLEVETWPLPTSPSKRFSTAA